jgi:hypothetical protein
MKKDGPWKDWQQRAHNDQIQTPLKLFNLGGASILEHTLARNHEHICYNGTSLALNNTRHV